MTRLINDMVRGMDAIEFTGNERMTPIDMAQGILRSAMRTCESAEKHTRTARSGFHCDVTQEQSIAISETRTAIEKISQVVKILNEMQQSSVLN